MELESKIEELSKQLGVIHKHIFDSTKRLQEFISYTTEWLEERRKETEKKGEKSQKSLYYRGLIMGLILGVLVNLFVSSFMKYLEFLSIPIEGWKVVTFVAFVCTIIWIPIFNREIKSLS